MKIMKRIKQTEHLDSIYEDFFDPIVQRTIRVERTGSGETYHWLLDRCSNELCAVPNTEEIFPWAWAFSLSAKDGAERTRVGKWLLFPDCSIAVHNWTLITAEVTKGGLWQAKISLTNSSLDEHRHVICVYTPDFCDVAEVRAVGIRLWQLGLGASRQKPEFYYKPDEFTYGGIYSGEAQASIYALRPGSTFIRKTAGFQHLNPDLQVRINEG